MDNTGFEFLFCGTGAADWDWSRYGRRGVRGSCATLVDGRVLLDCGATGFRSLLRWGVRPRALREVWFTHSHGDHCFPPEVAALLAARGPRAAPLVLRGTAPLLVMLGTALFIIFLTEFTSNTASAALLVPVFAAIAKPMGMPEAALVMMIGVGASFAFMMPVATPPNAIVFGSGQLRQSDMVRAGLVLNLVSTMLLGLWGWLVLL